VTGAGSGVLRFDAKTWTGSGQKVLAAASTLATAVNTLCGALEDAGACWGEDDIGQAFINGQGGKPGFAMSRDEVLNGLATMVNLLQETGSAMVVTGQGFAAAEQSNTIGAPAAAQPSAPAVSQYQLPPTASDLIKTDPPPGEFMEILGILEKLVAGCQWPDGSMSALGSMQQALLTASGAITRVKGEVEQYCKAVEAVSAGQTATQFESFAAKLCGDDGGLAWLAGACQGLAGSVHTLTEQKNAARMQFELSLVFLAISFAAAQALAVFTFGGSEAAFMGEAEAEGFALRAMLQAVARGVVEGIWYAGGMDLIAQFSQMANGLQSSFNWVEFGKSVGEGAVAGGVAGGLSYGLSSALAAAAGSSGLVKNLANLAGTNAVTEFAAKAAVGGVAGTVGSIAAQEVFDDGHVNLMQAGGFGLGMGVIGAALGGDRGPADAGGDVPADPTEARGAGDPADSSMPATGPGGTDPASAAARLASAGGPPDGGQALAGGHEVPATSPADGAGRVSGSTSVLAEPGNVHADLGGGATDAGQGGAEGDGGLSAASGLSSPARPDAAAPAADPAGRPATDPGSTDSSAPGGASGHAGEGADSDDAEDIGPGQRTGGWMRKVLNRSMSHPSDLAYAETGYSTLPPMSAPPEPGPVPGVPGGGIPPDLSGLAGGPGSSLPGGGPGPGAAPGISGVPAGTSASPPATTLPVPSPSVPTPSLPGTTVPTSPGGSTPPVSASGSPGATSGLGSGGDPGLASVPGTGSLGGSTAGTGSVGAIGSGASDSAAPGDGVTAGSNATSSPGDEPFGLPWLGGLGGLGAGAGRGEGRARQAWESEDRELWDPTGSEASGVGPDGMIGADAAWSDAEAPVADFSPEDSLAAEARFGGVAGDVAAWLGAARAARAEEAMRPVTDNGRQWQAWIDEEPDAWGPEARGTRAGPGDDPRPEPG
jgi:hypothetical protein